MWDKVFLDIQLSVDKYDSTTVCVVAGNTKQLQLIITEPLK